MTVMVNASTCKLGLSASPPDVIFIYFMCFTCNLESRHKMKTLLISKEIFSLAQELEFSVIQYENFLTQLSVLILKLLGPILTNL